jgi:Ca2+:H+ antiporter
VGDTTEHLAEHFGVTGGSLINVTFSNTPEIILSIVAVQAGLIDLVKANIIGSILGEILFVLGLSLVFGGLKYKEQIFNKNIIVFHTSTLFLAVFILSIPTILIFENLLVESNNLANNKDIHLSNNVSLMSISFAFILLIVYVFALIFTLKTHPHLFLDISDKNNDVSSRHERQGESVYNEPQTATSELKSEYNNKQIWSKKKSIGLLLVSMIGVAVISEILVGSVEETIKRFNLGVIFVGAIIVGIAGNVPEHVTSIMLARKGKLDLSLGIAASSGSQVALFVLPVIVIASMIIGKTFSMVFTSFELIAVFVSTILVNIITYRGKSNWFQGIILVALYIAIAIGFFFL